MIPYARQDISKEDIEAVIAVMKSDFLTQGTQVPRFEDALSLKCGAKYAVASTNGTSALHLACLALGVGHGDLVWTTPITFAASANCALYCGASVHFVDINNNTFNLCPQKLEEKLHLANECNALPKVVIPVHLAGYPCDMKSIYEVCKKYDVRIIEDASHAIGAQYHGEPVGSCKYSDITIFSFHPVKIITTGEGGAATTNQLDLLEKMRLLRSHGINKETSELSCDYDGPWYYEQIALGYNYRMTDIQAAIGISQLQRMEQFVRQRHRLKKSYDEHLEGLPIKTQSSLPNTFSSLHLYIIRLKLSEISMSHREIFERLRAENIGVNLHYIPVYRHPYYRQFKFDFDDFRNAETYYKEAISLPLYPGLNKECQSRVIQALRELLS